MDERTSRKYWNLVAQEIEQRNREGHPATWTKEVILRFLGGFISVVRQQCREDEKKAEACGLVKTKAGFMYDQLDLSYDTFRRIFVTGESKGRRATWNLFAVYLGANSYGEYLLEQKLNDIVAPDLIGTKSNRGLALPEATIDFKFHVYDNTWVGREEQLKQLTQKLENDCKLILLIGITGIGKTALAEKLIQEAFRQEPKKDRHYYRIDFDAFYEHLTFADVGNRVLIDLGQPPADQSSTAEIFRNFYSFFKRHSYLLVLDSLEHLLVGNEKEGWMDFKDNWWMRLFKEAIGDPSFRSIFMITTQDFPRQLATLGVRYPNRFYYTPLTGLSEDEQKELFNKLGLNFDPEGISWQYLKRMGNIFEGHPLALRVISGELVNAPYNGNVMAYWNNYGEEIESLEKATLNSTDEALNSTKEETVYLDMLNRELRNSLHLRLENTFTRLREANFDAYELLCATAHYNRAVPKQFWVNHLKQRGKTQEAIFNAFSSLKDRYLVDEVIENDNLLLRQHNLVRSVSLRHAQKL